MIRRLLRLLVIPVFAAVAVVSFAQPVAAEWPIASRCYDVFVTTTGTSATVCTPWE